MNAKFLLIFLSSACCVYGQNEAAICTKFWNNSYYGYTCDLTIINPNGLNNFNEISGQHLNGKSNEDVFYIYSYNSGANSTNIPSVICQQFPNLDRIQIQRFGIRAVDDYSFSNCKKIQYIYINENYISQIHENSFQNNPDLLRLSLQYNQIAVLPEKLFINLNKLQMLDLGQNRISTLPTTAFNTLISLDFLLLNNNLLTNLPANVFNALKNMTMIYLDSNKLDVIHAFPFGVLPKLKTANLHSNKIYAIDEKFIDNTSINLINMPGNICADKRIEDLTTRYVLRRELKQCFDNYKITFG
ncbi:unnamed protein product [Chironomus riparius]|uniref:Uncharacterized protein n=1 Tax=Chironomus riparius TaxID=315576 RepID=A0A9N9RKS0_9DIPT|nr:unnamed protein product [Chironomus riparius]